MQKTIGRKVLSSEFPCKATDCEHNDSFAGCEVRGAEPILIVEGGLCPKYKGKKGKN